MTEPEHEAAAPALIEIASDMKERLRRAADGGYTVARVKSECAEAARIISQLTTALATASTPKTQAAAPTPLVEGWLSMDTAPKDCSILLLIDDVAHEGRWQGPSDGAIYAGSPSVYNWFLLTTQRSEHDASVLAWAPMPSAQAQRIAELENGQPDPTEGLPGKLAAIYAECANGRPINGGDLEVIEDAAHALLAATRAEHEARAGLEKAREALRPITWQDLRLAVGEGKLMPSDVIAGCNAELARRASLNTGARSE